MDAILLFALYGLAFIAAFLGSGGRGRRFATLLIIFAFMVSTIYLAMICAALLQIAV